MNRPSWDEYFLAIVDQVARRSTCQRIPDGIGAIIVRDNQILATGYAGSIPGLPHCTEVGCLIDESGGCIRTVHAEMNAVLQARGDLKGGTVYCTMSPCLSCFKVLATSGISRMVYRVEYRTVDHQKAFAKACGIAFEHHGTKKYIGGKIIDQA